MSAEAPRTRGILDTSTVIVLESLTDAKALPTEPLITAVTLGPLLGLLGTIIGMIGSFNILGSSGTGDPMAVSGGIAHALIATACGLTIALVGVVALNYLNKRVRMVLLQMDMIKSMLVSRFAA